MGNTFENFEADRADFFRHRIPENLVPSAGADALDSTSQYCEDLYYNLTKGLGDRVDLVYLHCPEGDPWPLSLPAPRQSEPRMLYIGLLLNAEHAYRTVDHGPPSEDKIAAAQYRKFWGEKAELRRFRDGSLLETVIWGESADEPLIKQIVRYVIQRHHGETAVQNLQLVGNNFESMLSDSGPVDSASPIMVAFEKLGKDIRQLDGLPLQIRQITAASPCLRYASLEYCGTASAFCGGPGIDVCIQFEGSARWPNDIAAIQRTKIAFLLKLGELLEASNSERLTVKVGLENEEAKLLNSAFLDVMYHQSTLFRLRIHHERELNMLEAALRDKDSEFGKREDIALATAVYKRKFIQGPLHTQAVRTLCTRFPLLSPSMRLMKKWRNCHHLSGHVSDELVELLTIRTFVSPYPWQAPASLATAFLRTLAFISNWQWQLQPLVVDFNLSMSSEDFDSINLRFQAWRKIDPAMNRVVMFAASNIDHDGITWTELSPAKVVAMHFTSLAKAACGSAKNQGFGIQPERLFASSKADFDFVLHLSPHFATGGHLSERRKKLFKNLGLSKTVTSDSRSECFSVFVEELRSSYGSNVLFFHDELGGSYIGGIWNPQIARRPWKVQAGYSTAPLIENGEENITLNKHGTLNDIARLGAEMITKVWVKSI